MRYLKAGALPQRQGKGTKHCHEAALVTEEQQEVGEAWVKEATRMEPPKELNEVHSPFVISGIFLCTGYEFCTPKFHIQLEPQNVTLLEAGSWQVDLVNMIKWD
jgi:hypothetical protein